MGAFTWLVKHLTSPLPLIFKQKPLRTIEEWTYLLTYLKDFQSKPANECLIEKQILLEAKGRPGLLLYSFGVELYIDYDVLI